MNTSPALLPAPTAVADRRAAVGGEPRYLPEDLTPLFHTPVYAALPPAVRVRYNQLYACYFNEQVAFFEREMLTPALEALLYSAALPRRLAPAVRRFLEEEQSHTAMFCVLNERCAPELYPGNNSYHFIRLPAPGRAALRAFSRQAAALPTLLWLALLQEERSIYYSRRCLAEPSLHADFHAMHRAHLADETGHVGWDEALLDWLWPRLPRWQREASARLFTWMVSEFFHLPKRAGRRVTARLAQEFPALDAPALFRAMDGLQTDPVYHETLYSRRIVPRTCARFDAHPEFALFARTLTAYPAPGCPA